MESNHNVHRYLPHTREDVQRMLRCCGMSDLDELYAEVPSSVRLNHPYPGLDAKGMPEQLLHDYFKAASGNSHALQCFAGAGCYHHYTPEAVKAIVSRSEYLTAYTPYQPEISQGTLQYIFEYQSMMCELTGMDISNASVYDGATATAEAVNMAVSSVRKRRRILVSATLNPVVAQVLATYSAPRGIVIDTIPEADGVTDREALSRALGDDVAAVVVMSPNYYGILEDYSGLADEVHAHKALLVMNCPASPLVVIKTPGEWNADIACGEAQSLGIPMNYGGPGLGYICCRRQFMRKMPGRIVGATTDRDGKRCFVLTLQAREQHIRRQKATSNICSNQGIMTLHVAAYLSLMGADGLKDINRIGCDAAHHLADGLCGTGNFEMLYPGQPYLNEFALKVKAPLTADAILAKCAEAGILGGVKLSDDSLLVACTETTLPDMVNKYVELFEARAL